MAPAFFITAPDTGAGKTVAAAWLVRRLRERGWRVAAAKPVASGSRDDGAALAAAAGMELDEVNPWHFSDPVAPSLAARRDGRRVRLPAVAEWIEGLRRRWEVVVVEGAGGLLSPMGAGFDNRDLLASIDAFPVVVCPNRLGAVGQSRLVLEALPAGRRAEAALALTGPERPDAATPDNLRLLRAYWPNGKVAELPWRAGAAAAPLDDAMRRGLDRLGARSLRRLAGGGRPGLTARGEGNA